MSSYRQILYHIIFRPKNNVSALSLEYNHELFAYIMGIIKNNKCFLYRINGMEDHIHVLCDLHPSVALADLMRDIKTSTSIWLKQNKHFPHFEAWASGYAAFTYSYKEKDILINYVKHQQSHHQKKAFIDEYRELLAEHGIDADERFFPG